MQSSVRFNGHGKECNSEQDGQQRSRENPWQGVRRISFVGFVALLFFTTLLLEGCTAKDLSSVGNLSKFLSASEEMHIVAQHYNISSNETYMPNAAEYEVFKAVNVVRGKHGLHPLSLDSQTSKVAHDYSERMLKEGFFSHYDPQGRSVEDRLEEAGISYRKVGENLAYLRLGENRSVEKIAAEAVKGWMNSKLHRETMLDKEYETLGVGVACDDKVCYISTIYLNTTFQLLTGDKGFGVVELPLNGLAYIDVKSNGTGEFILMPKTAFPEFQREGSCTCYGMWKGDSFSTYITPNDYIVVKSEAPVRLTIHVKSAASS